MREREVSFKFDLIAQVSKVTLKLSLFCDADVLLPSSQITSAALQLFSFCLLLHTADATDQGELYMCHICALFEPLSSSFADKCCDEKQYRKSEKYYYMIFFSFQASFLPAR